MSSKAVSLLLGKVLPCGKPNASKICITRMDLDMNLLMYFKKYDIVYAEDPNKICKTGDIVLIEELSKKLSKLLTHRVRDVVYPLGDVLDPISGKKAVRWSLREDIVDATKMYGEEPNRFLYDKAPPRGWQEGKKDFTDKETYYKYQDDGTHQPYAL